MALKSSDRFLKTLFAVSIIAVLLMACFSTPTIPSTPVRVPPGQEILGRDKPIPEHQFMYGSRISAIDCSKCHKQQKEFLYAQINISGAMASPHTYVNKVTCIRCHQNVISDFSLKTLVKSCNAPECHQKKPILKPYKFVVSLQIMIRTRLKAVQDELKKRQKKGPKLKPLSLRLIRQELGFLIEDGSFGMHNEGLAIQILERAEKKLGLKYNSRSGKTEKETKTGPYNLF